MCITVVKNIFKKEIIFVGDRNSLQKYMSFNSLLTNKEYTDY